MTGVELSGFIKRAKEHIAHGAPKELMAKVFKQAGIGQLALLEGLGLGGEYLVSNDATKEAIKEIEAEKQRKAQAHPFNLNVPPEMVSQLRQNPEAAQYLNTQLSQLSNIKAAFLGDPTQAATMGAMGVNNTDYQAAPPFNKRLPKPVLASRPPAGKPGTGIISARA